MLKQSILTLWASAILAGSAHADIPNPKEMIWDFYSLKHPHELTSKERFEREMRKFRASFLEILKWLEETERLFIESKQELTHEEIWALKSVQNSIFMIKFNMDFLLSWNKEDLLGGFLLKYDEICINIKESLPWSWVSENLESIVSSLINEYIKEISDNDRITSSQVYPHQFSTVVYETNDQWYVMSVIFPHEWIYTSKWRIKTLWIKKISENEMMISSYDPEYKVHFTK